MSDRDEQIEQLRVFMREIAEVMDRHADVSRNFVLAEADPAEMKTGSESGGSAGVTAEVVREDLMAMMAAPRRKVCIRFGFDPRTGRRVCLQWVDAR
jgi:hypothetical protein